MTLLVLKRDKPWSPSKSGVGVCRVGIEAYKGLTCADRPGTAGCRIVLMPSGMTALFFRPSDQRGGRAAYIGALNAGLAAGGFLIHAIFAADGREKCSGLPLRRHDPVALATAI